MKYLIAIDQSTSGTKVALIDENLRTVRSARKPHMQYYPAPGYAEHDAGEIWTNTAALLREISAGLDRADIAGIGIANQRETTVIWDRASGEPVCRAVVWQDVRAKGITDRLQDSGQYIFSHTGLIPSPFYSAAKVAAVLEENPHLKFRAENGELCFGTIDSYLLYRLTGGTVFVTDMSNACRTQLLDIHACRWSPEIAEMFGIPTSVLPEKVTFSDADFGAVSVISGLEGVRITAMMGDSHASLFGHGCTHKGMVKTSYGTGSSIMMNTGEKPVLSQNGLSTSIGYACGGKVYYVLEGNITCSADTLVWVKDGLELISGMDELELAASVPDTGGVYLVPAFLGLGAPWFDEKARAILCGMNRGTTKAHVIRAALASIAHQNADALDAMSRDTGSPVKRLLADGGGSVNPLLMQMQSDYVPCNVSVPEEKELTLCGVAMMAGSACGFFGDSLPSIPISRSYNPLMDENTRREERANWADAISRSRYRSI